MSTEQVVNSIEKQKDDKPLILITDDSKVARLSLKNILASDYSIVEATDGMNAWEMLDKEPEINLVISDLSMPNLNGVGLLRKIRTSNDEKVRNMPVILITGNEEDEKIRMQLLSEGANELITKPYNSAELSEQVRRYTGRQIESIASSDVYDSNEFLDGITDKNHFAQHAKKELSFAIRNKNELAILILKLDQFESIKKHYSEPAIEHILITTAEIVRAHTRIEDTLAYFGNGTFAILLPATNAIGTRHLGKRILADLVAKQFYLGESDATVTVSIGVSAPEIKPGITYKDVLSLAEQRLQAAISAGGKRIVDKGNATITPVSTLITDDSDEQSAIDRLLKQTEVEMRRMAAQEVDKIRANQSPDSDPTTPILDLNELNNKLLHSAQENKLLKQEVIKLRKNSDDVEHLRKLHYETDSHLQQTKIKLQQLRNDYDAMRIRAEAAESNNSKLQETDNDRSIIEQHLLEERSQLQGELMETTQYLEQIQATSSKSKLIIRKLEQQIKTQKDEFELALAEEHMMRSMAEQKLIAIEEKQLKNKKENPFSLTAIPTIAPIEKNQDVRVFKPTIESSNKSVTHSHSKKVRNTGQPSIVKKDTETPKHVWSYKWVVLALIGAIALTGIQIWSSIKQQDETPVQSALSEQPVEEVLSLTTASEEEARLQAELTIRQIAEEEYQTSLQR